MIIAVNFPIYAIGKKKPENKKIRASTGFEPVTSAIPVRCSTNWAMKPHIGSEVNLLSSYLPVQWNDVKFIWNDQSLFHINFTSFHCTGRYELNKLTSLPMCGFIAQLVAHRTGIAEVTGSNPVETLMFFFFQASSFQLHKLENLLRWSLFTFVYNRSTNMNYFI